MSIRDRTSLRLILPLLCLVLLQGECRGETTAPADEQDKVRIHIGRLRHDIRVQLDKIEEKNAAEREIFDQLDEINRKRKQQFFSGD